MKKHTSLILTAVMLIALGAGIGTVSANEFDGTKIDLSVYIEPYRLESTSGTRMMGWDPENNVITVSNSYEDQWMGGTGKGFLIDGVTTAAVWSGGIQSDGFFLSATNFQSSNTTPDVNEWIIVNLQSAHNLCGFAFYGLYQVDGDMTGMPVNFTIAVSQNGTDWTTVVTRTDYAPAAGVARNLFTFDTVSAQYVKFAVTKIGGPVASVTNCYDLALTEIEVYESQQSSEPSESSPSESESTPSESSADESSSDVTSSSESSKTSSESDKPENPYVKIGADGKLDLTGMLGGLSGNTQIPGWDPEGKFIKTSKSFEVGWVHGYGKGFLIDGIIGDGKWPVSAGQFIAATLAEDGVHVKDANTSPDINEYIEINLQSVFRLHKFGFTGLFTDPAAKQSGVPSDFTIDVSLDGKNWMTVVSKKGYEPADGEYWNMFSFAPVNAQYIRLKATKAPVRLGDNKEFGYTIGTTEIAIYGTTPNGNAETGDSFNVILIIAVMALCIMVSAIIVTKKNRQEC